MVEHHGNIYIYIYMEIMEIIHLNFGICMILTCQLCQNLFFWFSFVSTWPKEFVYVRKVCGPNGPYEMELMPFQEVSLASYTTLSPAGLSHYVNGVPVSFVPLQRWLNERESYRALRKLRFFQAETTVTPQLVIQLVIQLLWLFLKVEDFDGFTMDLP